MEEHVVTAKARYIRMAPRKVRVVADAIRGKRVDEAVAVLTFLQRRAVEPVRKALDAAVDSARQKGNFDLDNLMVKAIFVDQGPNMKRGHARARGMIFRINHFMSHITVVVGEKE